MFNKSERKQLAALSVVLYGSETKWQKAFDAGQYDIHVSSAEVEEPVKTVQFAGKAKGKRGTAVSREKALAKGYITEEQVPATRKRQVAQTRRPTFQELLGAMATSVDAQKVGRLTEAELIQVLAYRYSTGGLSFPISLTTGAGAEAEKNVADMLALVPEDKRPAVQELLVPADGAPTGLPLDAFQFLTDYVFALNHADTSKNMVDEALAAIDLTPAKPKIPYQMLKNLTLDADGKAPVQRNVSPEVVARRRAKNKAARAARRVNRSA